MRHRLSRLAAALALAALAVGLAGCSQPSTADLGNAVCASYTKQLTAASKIEDRDLKRVRMLLAHRSEAKALGRLDDPRIVQMARVEAAIAKWVQTRISGAPSNVNLPEGWEDAYHMTWQRIGLEECANRGPEYPDTDIDAGTSAPGQPPPASAQPIPGWDREGEDALQFRDNGTGDLFDLAPGETEPGTESVPATPAG